MNTQDIRPNLGPEWELLERICFNLENDNAETIASLVADKNLRFGVLIEKALRHGILPLLARALEQNTAINQFPDRLRHFLRSQLALNRYRNNTYTRECIKVVRTLERHVTPVACTKGVIFQFTIYDEPATRVMFDIDVMIQPEHREQVSKIMTALGYRIGIYDWSIGTIVPLPREREILYRLNPDHLPHHLRLTQRELIPYIAVDFANSITWARSEWQVPMDVVMADLTSTTVTYINDQGDPKRSKLPSLSVEYGFLFAILHLFREAWFQRTASNITLGQFCDIVRLWHRERDTLRNLVPRLVDRYNLADPVAWVCEHTDSVFGSSITDDLQLRGQVSDAWLQSTHGTDGIDMFWAGTMRERLHHETLE